MNRNEDEKYKSKEEAIQNLIRIGMNIGGLIDEERPDRGKLIGGAAAAGLAIILTAVLGAAPRQKHHPRTTGFANSRYDFSSTAGDWINSAAS